ncbi:C-GCAxxG-C-C family protein [Desulfurobacterium thermolithotrophum]|uniref:C-GCAxxG-C-C family protein n=1 Tax=Desulfurobacterium thermolithotrophum TaxID=64160 RepID=UPI0013D3BD18|nr:C-GCAxxG-C-C family protein [Desulfurobacterium thermolithotrophum]
MNLKEIMENIRFILNRVEKEKLIHVEPRTIAQRAYELYWKQNCEYGVVNSFSKVGGLKFNYFKVLEISKELPHKWNKICGAITGAFYIFAVTLPEEAIEDAVKEIIEFHNNTKLPIFIGNKEFEIPKVAVGSILCRDSIINWSKAAGIHPRALERSERCARITGDIAFKTAQILNKHVGALTEANI